MLNKNNFKIPIKFEKINDVCCYEGRFTRVKIYLMHLGANYNGSYFDKEAVDNAIPTLAYIPIVGFIEKDQTGENDFSDHRWVTVEDEDGVKEKYAGQAYGVILSEEENNAHYETKICDDGIEREFLVVEGITWDMFKDSTNILKKSFSKGQSMELRDGDDAYDGFEDENGFFHFTKFSFRAACFLGDNYEPAMINSKIEIEFSMHNFINSIGKEINNKIMLYMNALNKIKKGGKRLAGTSKDKQVNFSQTASQTFEDVQRVVSSKRSEKDEYGWSHPLYWMRDIQDDIVIVEEYNSGKLFGFPLSFNGDEPVVDFENGVRKKATYVDYVTNESESEPEKENNEIPAFINEMKASFSKKISELNKTVSEKETVIQQVNERFEEVHSEYKNLKNTVEQKQKEEEKQKKKNEIEQYEFVLSGTPEFEYLKENMDSVSFDDIKNKCAVLYTKKTLFSLGSKEHLKGMSSRLPGKDDDDLDEGKVKTRYGNINIG